MACLRSISRVPLLQDLMGTRDFLEYATAFSTGPVEGLFENYYDPLRLHHSLKHEENKATRLGERFRATLDWKYVDVDLKKLLSPGRVPAHYLRMIEKSKGKRKRERMDHDEEHGDNAKAIDTRKTKKAKPGKQRK
ncbi:hypothetical protein MMC13_003768 [Lambiella insularis]|nr:hypothetical protein [Lambiella insularis]